MRVLSCRANDHAMPRGAHLLQDVLESRALLVGQAPADAEHVGVRDEHQVPAGEADLLGESRAFAPERVLRHLNHHVLAGAEHLLDAGRLALDLLVVGDLARVQHGVATAAHVDEGCLHAGKDVLHASEVDIADHGMRALAGDEVLDELALLHHGDLVAVAELGDEHALVGDTLGSNDRLPATAARRSCPAPSTRPGGRGLGRGLALRVLGVGLRGPGLGGRGPAASPTASPASGGCGRRRLASRSLGLGGGRLGRLCLRGCGLAPAPARRAAVRARGFLRVRLLLLLLLGSGLRFSLRLCGRGAGPGALSLIGGTAAGRSRYGGSSPSAATSAAAPSGFGGRSAFGRLCRRPDFPDFFACQRSFLPPLEAGGDG